MPPNRVPIKGEPDFTTISDERLAGFIDLAQQMIFAYKYLDEEKVKVLQAIWKDMTNESSERLCASAIASLEKQENEPVTPTFRRIKLTKIKR